VARHGWQKALENWTIVALDPNRASGGRALSTIRLGRR
jgi:hypothetical protein